MTEKVGVCIQMSSDGEVSTEMLCPESWRRGDGRESGDAMKTLPQRRTSMPNETGSMLKRGGLDLLKRLACDSEHLSDALTDESKSADRR